MSPLVGGGGGGGVGVGAGTSGAFWREDLNKGKITKRMVIFS